MSDIDNITPNLQQAAPALYSALTRLLHYVETELELKKICIKNVNARSSLGQAISEDFTKDMARVQSNVDCARAALDLAEEVPS